ncbi:HU family DNA-binding protein [Caldanaerobacter subterraneus]|uniref:Integration host factor subunit beta n=1 Tax=Caldanaerobacter subterraneus TaxID=911092 RepID=A0A7Y2L879_9THEO|nr:HU family DNA-binding protein [Caldanaerobacter subterraneus]NNG67549.1 hypothetical protein [Caldanaerobacter subterraneus]
MNRTELIKEVSKRSEIDKDKLDEIFDFFLKVMIENIHNLYIRGFGKFQVRVYKPKVYHDVVENKLKESDIRVRIVFMPSKKVLKNIKKEIRKYGSGNA